MARKGAKENHQITALRQLSTIVQVFTETRRVCHDRLTVERDPEYHDNTNVKLTQKLSFWL